MALNRDKVGQVYPSYTYEVTRAKIHEYATAVQETDPRYFSDGDDCVAPPSFAACFTVIRGVEALFADEELGAHPALVHGSQRYRFGTRPMRPGDRLVCTPRIADITVRGDNEMLTVEVDCRFEDTEERAVHSEGMLVFLGSASSDTGSPPSDTGSAPNDTGSAPSDSEGAA